MPTCGCCGEDQFDCVDGMYYCQNCQTQSQEIRVELEDESPFGAYTAGLTLREKAKEKVPAEVDKGRPWLSHEAFTIILREQTRALIKLGAHSKLEDVVLRLWMRYLSVCHVAFPPPDGQHNTDDEAPRNSALRVKNRDELSCLVGDEGAKRRKASARTKAHKMKVEATRRNEMQEIATLLASEEFYEGDNPVDDDHLLTEASLWEDMEDDELEPTMGHGSQHKDKRYMTMQKTLSLLYLALHFTNNLVMPFDIVRWVQQGRIPYGKSIGNLLPADMTFHEGDTQIFCSGFVPSAHQVRQTSGALAHFIGIKQLPIVDMQALISRFILQLNLPGGLHSLAQSLLRSLQLDVSFRCRTIVPYEKFAVSYIIIILKLLFGLNDSTEKALSTYAISINKAHPRELRLFVWSEWVSYMEQATMLTEHTTFPLSENDIRSMRSLNACVKTHQDTGGTGGKFAHSHKKCTYRADDLRQSLQQPFLHMESRQITINETQPPSMDFTNCSLRYLTEDDATPVNNYHDLSDASIYSSCIESDDSDFDASQDLFQLSKPRRKRPSVAQTAVRRALKTLDISLSQTQTETPTKPRPACESYVTYPLNSLPCDRHMAYEQLLRLCAGGCDVGTETLHDCVQRLQLVYIQKGEDLSAAEKRIKRHFKYTYFSAN